jgi:mono/diheme cytochrome c family protein
MNTCASRNSNAAIGLTNSVPLRYNRRAFRTPALPSSSLVPRNPLLTLVLFVSLLAAGWSFAAEPKTGAEIYKEQCAVCHGSKGEGTDSEYPQELTGDKSLLELTKLIDKTMPKDSPEDCQGEDAERVAKYIFDAFYSPVAQARNKPAKVELSRLTVRQYRHAVADLVGSFRTPGKLEEARGLRGEYINDRSIRSDKRLIERVDPEVRFDFGTAGPDPAQFDANQFSIRWQGAVLAPETGEYEFIVRTDHAARLWVNDENTALIDRWVKSGSDTEFRESIWLLGGRIYPLRLEFSKAKQGVDDSKKQNGKPKEIGAFISLEWKPPQRTAEVIPSRFLSPERFPAVFVASTPFPPDDRSMGYERGTSISKAWDVATTDAAIETANYVVAHLNELAGVRGGNSGGGRRRDRDRPRETDPDRETKIREFCRQFAERAFRRTLSEEERQLYVDRQLAGTNDLETAAKRVVLLALKSPRFLYREPWAPGDAYDVASRLSFGLWDSQPDAELLRAAGAGELASREQVQRQAERMLADPRATAKLRTFFLQWLKIEQAPDLAKDPEHFPGFTPEVASDLRASLELLLDEVLTGKTADFRRLLLADYLYLNGRLAQFYGADLPADAPFQKVALEPAERSGVVAHPYLLADFAYTASSSPIHRGVFISRALLGRTLRPPPEAVAPIPPDLHPSLTTRERVVMQTKNEACIRCHGMINPLGFTLENFDAVGRYRKEEKGKPIDASGVYQTRKGESLKFENARQLAKYLSESEETQTALVEQLFHFTVKQPIRAFGQETSQNLRKSFVEQGFNIRKLAVEIMTVAALQSPNNKP